MLVTCDCTFSLLCPPSFQAEPAVHAIEEAYRRESLLFADAMAAGSQFMFARTPTALSRA
jgi:hypothetical protein